MSWDAFQREALAELGHVLYRPLRVAPPGDGVVDFDAGMLARLARAAGIEAEALLVHLDIAGLTHTLCGDAAAKRVLWPRLRALRRSLA